jgi:type IV pilus assembly protein PilY1
VKKYILILLVFLFSSANPLFADDADLFATQANPNVLIILDNSNSMDEDFYGNAVGSFSSTSKTVVGKKALRNIIDSVKDKLRVGLMTYNISGVSAYQLHNSTYFASYDPRSYCPNPPPECVQYAQTGNGGARGVCASACKADNSLFDVDYFDEILNNYAIGTEPHARYSSLLYPHKQKMVNPTDPSKFIYYKHAYPFYSGSNQGTAFCYGTGYSPNEGAPWDSYTCWSSKTGTNDDYPSGYSGSSFGISLVPTDSDYALGYKDFGKRLNWYYVGRTWFAEGSPGNGYLQVPADDLVDDKGKKTATYTNVWNKLDPKENDEAGYMSCGAGDKNTCSYIVNAGLTPTAGTFQEVIKYFQGQSGYTSPIQSWCQKNFIIYVTDGLPSVNEGGNPGSADTLMPTVLARIDSLRNTQYSSNQYDIRTYVLGVGLSDEAKVKLDDMAVRGGTDVSGHAYYADDPGQLIDALGQIFKSVVESAYSFASPTVPSVRMITEDTLYLSSFTPSTKNPFWPGSLKAYQLNQDGTLPVDANGFPLKAPIWVASIPDSGSRVIKTYVGGGLKDFTSSNLAPGDLGVGSDDAKNNLISYIRNLGLGDIFHSNSVIVGSPSQFFEDVGFSVTGGFYLNNKDRTKVIIVGANDGMLHAFNAGNWNTTTGSYDTGTGVEEWAFIPNSLLQNLKTMQTTHTYYVDSTPKVADVWFDDNGDNKKTADEWRTVLVSGLRKGGKHYFALDITDTLKPKYLWEFPHPGDPKISDYNDFLNNILGQSWSEPVIGKVKIEKGGNLVERWVAFIGGGFDPSEKIDKDATIGRAFFVVDIKTGEIIWQFSYDKDDPVKKWMNHALPASPTVVDTNLDGYVDKVYIGDMGGQVWIFDVSFNELTKKSDSLWAGKRLFKAPKGGSEKHNIYYAPAVAFDNNGIPWVYFGTGDREDPKDFKNERERFYAVKDDGSGNYPRDEGDLKDVTLDKDNTFAVDATKKGWYIKLEKSGKQLEKVLAKPAVFNRLLYFTTYTYTQSADPCAVAGVSKKYVVEFLSGGGALNVDDMSDILNPPSDFVHKRSQEIGSGAPSAPVITVNMKGKASVIIGTTSGQISSGGAFSLTTNREILYWREVVP